MKSSPHSSTTFSVGIVGAGFAGLVAALRLKKQGRNDFVIFEKAEDLGGTWRDNTYPGCACDIVSPLYSFADEPNPQWSHRYAPQPEILGYMQEVAARHGLYDHLRLGCAIQEATYDRQRGGWLVTDQTGQTTFVRALLLGLGPLNRAHVPDFPGLDRFAGRHFHSSQWDHGYEMEGKRVAVIGTGASAIQIVPELATKVKALKAFQRTPAWVADRWDKPFSARQKALFARMPALQRLLREAHYWWNEFLGLGFIGHRRIHGLMHGLALRKLEREVQDPNLRNQLTPQYTLGCKRVLRSDDYLPTFNQAHVELVTAGIERFEPPGIRDAEGTLHELDAVVFATGFKVSDLDIPISIHGLSEKPLFEQLKQSGGDVFKGMTVPGFPNLAFILGPNTGLGHNSVVHMMESQMNYLSQYLAHFDDLPQGQGLDLKPEALQTYIRRIQGQFAGTVWQSGCQSWYLNEQGKNNTLFPRLNTHFRRLTRRFHPQAYRVVPQVESVPAENLL